MSLELSTAPIPQRFQHLLKATSSQRFLKMEGLNNDIPFFICHYEVKEALEFLELQENLKQKLSQAGIKILEVNLYDLAVEILKTNGDWQDLLDAEAEVSKQELKEELQSILEPASHLVPAIKQKMDQQDFDILFLSGIGEVFPYLRSHNILNNLQSTAKDRPTLLFFPGSYTHSLEDGASLDLFGRLHDDKYYRAFDIYNFEV